MIQYCTFLAQETQVKEIQGDHVQCDHVLTGKGTTEEKNARVLRYIAAPSS